MHLWSDVSTIIDDCIDKTNKIIELTVINYKCTVIIKRLVKAGDYNKAENMLFQAINENNSQETYEIAIGFYNLLLEKSDEELEEGSFSREEIYQGLQDLKNIYRK